MKDYQNSSWADALKEFVETKHIRPSVGFYFKSAPEMPLMADAIRHRGIKLPCDVTHEDLAVRLLRYIVRQGGEYAVFDVGPHYMMEGRIAHESDPNERAGLSLLYDIIKPEPPDCPVTRRIWRAIRNGYVPDDFELSEDEVDDAESRIPTKSLYQLLMNKEGLGNMELITANSGREIKVRATPKRALAKLPKLKNEGDDTISDAVEMWLSLCEISARKNELTSQIELHTRGGAVVMDDAILADLRLKFCTKTGGPTAKDTMSDALNVIATRNSYHPVKDYLSDLPQWDGRPRLDTWLVDFAGAPDTPLNRAIGRKFLCAAIRRADKPGCKFDAMLVLKGPQGARKSSLCAAVSPNVEWFTDQVPVGADAQKTIEQTGGAWIVEMPELDGLNKQEATRVKSFITTTVDKSRMAYGRYSVTAPRQFVMIGTTNDAAFLTDTSGNRRWWIVSAPDCDPVGFSIVRDQILAEAYAAEADEKLWLENDVAEAQSAVSDKHMDFGPYYETLLAQMPDAVDLKVSSADVWRMIGIDTLDTHKINSSMRANMARALSGLGFNPTSKPMRDVGGVVRGYVKGDEAYAVWWGGVTL